MKKSILILIILFVQINLFAQTIPETFNYQAVARADDGSPIINQEVILEISIVQGTNCETATGCNVVWQEIHYPTTNEFGLFSIQIGNGQTTYEGSATNFTDIDWYNVASGNYFMKMRVDFGSSNFGSGLIDMGTIKLQSVPYSLVAENATDIVRVGGKLPFGIQDLENVNITGLTTDQILQWNGSEWVNVTFSTSGAPALHELTDVNNATSPILNNILIGDGTNWTNQELEFNNIANTSISSPATNELIIFDGTNWINSEVDINIISDINTTGATIGQVLTFDGTNWVAQNSASGGLWTSATDYIYAPNEKGIVATGTYGTGNMPITGAGTRFVFFHGNAALRAGRVDNFQWDDPSVGNYSVAFGQNTTASGSNSFAMGSGTTASITRAVAFGLNTTASGTSAAVFGETNTAGGTSCLVTGSSNNASANANYAIVGGENNNISAESGLIVGTGNVINAANSFAFGSNCQVEGSATNGFVGGETNIVRGEYSAALGLNNSAQAYASFYIGRFSTIAGTYDSWIATEPLFVAGNGADAGNKNDALVLLKNGNLHIDGINFEPPAKNSGNNKTINNTLEKLEFVNGISYDQKGKTTFGFDAQELEKTFPELVSNNSNGGQSISYSRFTPVLLEAVKEQQVIINELKAENKELKQKYEEMNKRLEKLEN